MSKYFQEIQKFYKFKISNKSYNKNSISSIYLYKYWIAFNIFEITPNQLKKITIYCNNLDLHHYSFNFQHSKKNPLKKILNNLNRSLYIYATNKNELFFLILKEITLFHLICYEKFFINFNDELQLSLIFNFYDKNYSYLYFFLINTWYINILIFSFIFEKILELNKIYQ